MNDPELTRHFALGSQELRAQMPPATLLPAIHRRLDRGPWAPRAQRPHRWSWFGWAGLGTACVALAAVLLVDAVAPGNLSGTASDPGFIALVDDEVWQQAQGEPSRTWLVTTEMPHTRLAALGLPYDPSRAGERVPAQLLMHSSGEVLALRVNSP
ncbi:hypothetical protein GCM10027034_43700 [Ramlibacter solisilvae]|uniref:hypothetical protein n=1 Tax=Ramlibacter tataouinensis TaxID=94132 RepID=UPI000777BA8B|nr:hypothetical protein [Ramlibacter tataouinensis]